MDLPNLRSTTADTRRARRVPATPIARWMSAAGVALVVSACGGTPGGGAADSAAPAGATAAGTTAASDAPDSRAPDSKAKPFALTYRRDDSRAVTKRLEAEAGGTIEATNAAGDLIRLQVSPKTLAYDETVTLTPLEGLGGIDGAERLIGVSMEPSGVEFSAPAVLTITPRDALAGDVWWFESLAGSEGKQLRPAPPLERQSGMNVWHFSTGAVAAGAAALSDVIRSRAPGELTPASERVSSEVLEWRRNQAEQDYQAGRIDKATYDALVATLQELEEKRVTGVVLAMVVQVYKQIAEEPTRRRSEIQQLREVARGADPKDLDRLAVVMRQALRVERDARRLGRTDSEWMRRLSELIDAFADGVLRDCAKRAALGREIARFMLDYERLRELQGSAEAVGLANCVPRQWHGLAQIDGNYGRVNISLRKSDCSLGIFGDYVYAVSGAVTGSFEFEAKAPRDNTIIPTPFTLQAQVSPKWTDKTYACTQSGEVAISAPPDPVFDATARSGSCAGSDDLGGVDMVETTAIPMTPGALCR